MRAGLSVGVRQLYVNGKRAIRARGPWPEGGGRYGDLAIIDGEAGHTLPGESMADWKNQEDIELGYFNSWSHMIGKVKSITRDGSGGVKIAMQQPEFLLISRKEGVQAQMPAYIENAYELLDEPGEWYFDKHARTLYYIPREGEDMEKAEVILPFAETLLSVNANNVRFEGITFADATWLAPNDNGHADVQANFTIYPRNLFVRDNNLVNIHNEYWKSPGNIVLGNATRISFERCVFTRLGGATAIELGPGSQDVAINGCRFLIFQAVRFN